MELKDVILSTLAEMEEELPEQTPTDNIQTDNTQSTSKEVETKAAEHSEQLQENTASELLFLTSIRERLLVLFEGFQAPNNANIEAKIDMTLNFLEYTLATIDARVEKLEKGNIQ